MALEHIRNPWTRRGLLLVAVVPEFALQVSAGAFLGFVKAMANVVEVWRGQDSEET